MSKKTGDVELAKKDDKKNNQFTSVNNQIHFTSPSFPHGQDCRLQLMGEYTESIATYLIKTYYFNY